MSGNSKLDIILKDLVCGVKEIYGDELHAVILYGSYARGDYDEESDVDIMVLADVPLQKLSDFRSQTDELCGRLLYDYGLVVSVTERDTQTYYRYADILPFYKNIKEEGVRVA